MDEAARNIVISAYDMLKERGWAQNPTPESRADDYLGPLCVTQAIYRAWQESGEGIEARNRANRYLYFAICEELGDELGERDINLAFSVVDEYQCTMFLVRWNDHPATTVEEVHHIFEIAIFNYTAAEGVS